MAIQTPTVSSCTKYHTWVHTPTLPMPPSSSTSDDHILLRHLHSMVFVDAHYYPCLCVIVIVTLIHCLHPGAANLSCTCSFSVVLKWSSGPPFLTCPGHVQDVSPILVSLTAFKEGHRTAPPRDRTHHRTHHQLTCQSLPQA